MMRQSSNQGAPRDGVFPVLAIDGGLVGDGGRSVSVQSLIARCTAGSSVIVRCVRFANVMTLEYGFCSFGREVDMSPDWIYSTGEVTLSSILILGPPAPSGEREGSRSTTGGAFGVILAACRIALAPNE